MKRKIYNVLAVILAVVFAVSAVGFCVVLADYRRAAKLYEGAQDEYVVQNTFEPLKGEVDIDIDFEALISDNQEVVGWIYAPNTDVNYPVLQTKDNRKYLHKGLDGKYLRSGSIFMDYRNDELLSDRNYILYGHSMRNGSMFGALLKYKEQAYYDQHPIWYYITPNQTYRIELFAGRVAKSDHIVYQTEPDVDEFTAYINESKSKSTFDSAITVAEQDVIVTLSTCSYEFDQARYVVLGKLVPIE